MQLQPREYKLHEITCTTLTTKIALLLIQDVQGDCKCKVMCYDKAIYFVLI